MVTVPGISQALEHAMKIVIVAITTGKMNMTILYLIKIGGSSPNKPGEPLANLNKFSEETI